MNAMLCADLAQRGHDLGSLHARRDNAASADGGTSPTRARRRLLLAQHRVAWTCLTADRDFRRAPDSQLARGIPRLCGPFAAEDVAREHFDFAFRRNAAGGKANVAAGAAHLAFVFDQDVALAHVCG